MKFNDLYKSVFAILRIEGTQAKIVGTGFVINTNPIYIITCNHVVSEASENNDGSIKFSITKRSDSFEVFDIRNAKISFLAAKKVICKPEFDLAILEIDPNINKDIANQLDIDNIRRLELSFDEKDRELGSSVEWLSTAASGDLSLTPRFFKGNLVTNYISYNRYKFKNAQGIEIEQIMIGANILEVDQLFIPGSSGSPIIDSNSSKVIGYVHGFKSWPILTAAEIVQEVEITENEEIKKVKMKYGAPLIASLSLGIDLRTVAAFLQELNLIQDEKDH